jgi:protein-disulfide isomerase-like protein with CxxC motif
MTFSLLLRDDVKNIDDVSGQYFINATPQEFISDKNKIIDARPFTDDGKSIAELQAKEQFKIYTGIQL